MSEHTYQRHSKSKFIITGPKDKYSNIAKETGGVWKTAKNGWVIDDSSMEMFKKLINVICPDNEIVFDEILEPAVVSTAPTRELLGDLKPKRKFRRARSIGSSDSEHESVKNDEPPSPKQYGGNIYDESDEFSLTSSDSDDDSDSSQDFPHSSPNRKKLANDNVLDKMERTRRRMFELDMADKRNKAKK